MAFDEEKEDRRLLPSECPFEEIVSDILKVNPKKEKGGEAAGHGDKGTNEKEECSN